MHHTKEDLCTWGQGDGGEGWTALKQENTDLCRFLYRSVNVTQSECLREPKVTLFNLLHRNHKLAAEVVHCLAQCMPTFQNFKNFTRTQDFPSALYKLEGDPGSPRSEMSKAGMSSGSPSPRHIPTSLHPAHQVHSHYLPVWVGNELVNSHLWDTGPD